MDAAGWDERYRLADLVWSATPNRWVEAECADLPPGSALDLACGEGRNAIWLSGRGWRVTGVDFSPVAIAKARARSDAVTWLTADVLAYDPPRADLVVVAYLQLSPERMRYVIGRAARATQGTLLVIGHDIRNLTEGTGGPQDADVLYSPQDVVDAIGGELSIARAETVVRPVEGIDRPALDVLVKAVRPPAAKA